MWVAPRWYNSEIENVIRAITPETLINTGVSAPVPVFLIIGGIRRNIEKQM